VAVCYERGTPVFGKSTCKLPGAYRGTSLKRKCPPPESCSSPVPRVLGGVLGAGLRKSQHELTQRPPIREKVNSVCTTVSWKLAIFLRWDLT